MILDSTFINDLVRQQPVATDKLAELIDTGTPIALSTLTVFEVGVGLRGEAERHRERFDGVVDEIDVVPFTAAAARHATATQRKLVDRGERIGEVDVLIAGTAVERDEGVLTRNVDEFGRIDALDIDSY
ncbi:PIN domain-containing protein [Halococcus agarilyticus]|uniref:PIN domain-containing protein n=1 Tax=Halococcus agarilyticus TaxID=1232219 RepID=UPI000B1B9C2F|nr:PIN domain-containing protein [Halococcus agarilyticus]